MTLRIDLKDLGEEVCASLERGEAVEIERDGRVVAKIEPPKGGLLALWERWQEMEPLDEDSSGTWKRFATGETGPSNWMNGTPSRHVRVRARGTTIDRPRGARHGSAQRRVGRCPGELLMGVAIAPSARLRDERARFAALVEREFEALDFDLPAARIFATVDVTLRRAGTPVGERDLMIAATALANGHDVLTANVREFERVPELRVVTLEELAT